LGRKLAEVLGLVAMSRSLVALLILGIDFTAMALLALV
jgi:hypothetical protein